MSKENCKRTNCPWENGTYALILSVCTDLFSLRESEKEESYTKHKRNAMVVVTKWAVISSAANAVVEYSFATLFARSGGGIIPIRALS